MQDRLIKQQTGQAVAGAGWLELCEILSEFIAHEHVERPQSQWIQYTVSRLGNI